MLGEITKEDIERDELALLKAIRETVLPVHSGHTLLLVPWTPENDRPTTYHCLECHETITVSATLLRLIFHNRETTQRYLSAAKKGEE